MKMFIFIFFAEICLCAHLLEVNKVVVEKSFENLDTTKPQCNFYIRILKRWIELLEVDPLFFENPFSNFKAAKTLSLDLPRACGEKGKSKQIPKNVQHSIEMAIDIVNTYDVEIEKVFELIPDMDASDCFIFCSGALIVDKKKARKVREATLIIASKFLEKGRSLMGIFSKQGDEKLMDKADERLEDLKDNFKFRNLCSHSKIIYPLHGSGLCTTVMTPTFRIAKVEVLNTDPLVAIYDDFLSQNEFDTFTSELSKYPFEIGSVSDEYGDDENVTFKVQKDIDNTENKVVDEIQKIMDEIADLFPDVDDYTQVVKYRPGGEFHLHVDFHTDEELDEDDELGNRVGHSMIFLQSAELGGGFAMPKFNIHITPKPGRMAHWRNVDSNGINAPMSLHGGCHVFAGNKVVAIKDYHHPFQKHWQCKKK